MHATANIAVKIRFMIKFLALIDVAHPFDIVAEAENESASSTKRARVHEASAFDRNGNTSTAILLYEYRVSIVTSPIFLPILGDLKWFSPSVTSLRSSPYSPVF
jgi:hypothetical protein